MELYSLFGGLQNGFKLARNLRKLWVSGIIFEKHKLQQIIFPDGIGFDKQNDKVLTFRVNSLFHLIGSITSVLQNKKSGDSIKFDQISARVTLKVEKSNFYEDVLRILENIE